MAIDVFNDLQAHLPVGADAADRVSFSSHITLLDEHELDLDDLDAEEETAAVQRVQADPTLQQATTLSSCCCRGLIRSKHSHNGVSSASL
jgi:hypothetical protein